MTKRPAPMMTTALDGKVEFFIAEEFRNRLISGKIHEREFLGLTGRIALSLTERFALVTAEPSGEDSTGRQAMQLMSPEAVVGRAVSIAELLMAKLRTNGHVAEFPSMKDAYELSEKDDA